jgi:holo-[acyl-carrier protein] synthase
MVIGLGIDLVEIARVERMLAEKGERVHRRLFTPDEVAYACARTQPARHFAARLAAKEAAFKALAGNALARGIGWRDIETVMDDGRPTIVLHGRAAERAAELGVTRVLVSLSHSEGMATAVVVVEGGREGR